MVFPLAEFLQIINRLDTLLSSFLPLKVRIPLWGALAGTMVVSIFYAVSNRAAIAELKSTLRDLRTRMMDPALEELSEYTELAKENLRVSVSLLLKVIGPALVAATPVVLIVMWVDTFHGHAFPTGGEAVKIFTVPEHGNIEIRPKHLMKHAGGEVSLLQPEDNTDTITVLVDGKTVYSGRLFIAPQKVITKKSVWSFILPGLTGYILPDAPVEEIRLDLPKQRFFSSLPSWASGWELPFYAGLTFTAVILGFVLKIY